MAKTTKLYFKNKATGKLFEVVNYDQGTNEMTLKGDFGEFVEVYDKQKFMDLGYERIKKEVEEDA